MAVCKTVAIIIYEVAGGWGRTFISHHCSYKSMLDYLFGTEEIEVRFFLGAPFLKTLLADTLVVRGEVVTLV